ncbi:MAG: hypothetical protein ABI083_20425, partial [Lapillicoccus sp.]
VFEGKLYLIGGCYEIQDSYCGTTDVQVYDPVADTWNTGPAYPSPTSYIACGGLDTIVCTGGTSFYQSSPKQGLPGTSSDGSPQSALPSAPPRTPGPTSASGLIPGPTYSLDPTVGRWVKAASAPASVYDTSYAVANGKLVVSGGLSALNAAHPDTVAYNPATRRWEALPAAPLDNPGGAGACGFYRLGGTTHFQGDRAYVQHLQGYDQCGTPWLSEPTTTVTIPPGASRTVTLALDGRIASTPGSYTSLLALTTSTPYVVPPVPVTLHVTS